MKDAVSLLVVFMFGLLTGHYAKECPKPPDPVKVIEEVEVIRYKDRPIIKEVTKRVETIIKEPYYTGECLDDSGLRAVTDLIKGTAAGRKDLDATSGAATD